MLKICLVFWKSEPQYAYKRYAYKKYMYLHYEYDFPRPGSKCWPEITSRTFEAFSIKKEIYFRSTAQILTIIQT